MQTIRLKKLPPSNFEKTDGIVMRLRLSLLWWLLTGRGTGLRYTMIWEGFTESGMPCHKPPWGLLVAVDLHHGEIVWQVPVGETESGVRGLFNYGPPLVAAGGLVFHAGSRDLRLRAHDMRTGEVLAQFALPAGLHTGPISYKRTPNGKPYLVVAPGGHIGLGTKLDGYVIAYTLPD